MNENEMVRQINEMYEKGVGGFFIVQDRDFRCHISLRPGLRNSEEAAAAVPDGLPVHGGVSGGAGSRTGFLLMDPASAYYLGYPYYAGTLEFSRKLSLPKQPDSERFVLRFPDWDVYDTVEVLVGGEKLGIRTWTPYEGEYFDYQEHKVKPVWN